MIDAANDTEYGLACYIFTENVSRAVRVAHAIEAGTSWVGYFILFASIALSLVYYYHCQVNCGAFGHVAIPFGGYKQSGVGRELGKLALDTCVLVLVLYRVLVCS